MQKRNAAADIIRCLALFFVISVHFFLNNGYYTQPVEGMKMFIMTMMRSLFIICVPLFITLSGYLLRKKQLSIQYYSKVSKVIMTYVLTGILCMIYSAVFLKQELTVKDMLLNLLDFSANPYSWYIEMYLGLFLLIPFLNILYNNIPSQKWKLCLIGTFITLTALPAVINVYNFDSLSWWTLPTSSYITDKLIPAWWVGLYPITYYFIGCYLNEYGIKIKLSTNCILIVLCILSSGLFTFWRTQKTVFIWGSWCDYTSIFNVVLTVLVFTLITNMNYDKFPPKLSLFLQKVSGLCLGGYLLSYIFDSALYPILAEKVPVVTDRLGWYFIIVPVIYIGALMLSYLVSKIQLLLEFLFAKLVCLFKKRKKDEA